MLNLPGYEIVEKIYESSTTVVYRGNKIQDKRPIVLKAMTNNYPSPKEIAQFQHQYEIVKNLNFRGIVKSLGVENYQNGIVLLLEDFGGKSLNNILSETKNLIIFLKIAIQISEALGYLHQQEVIHKDIKPHNILINLELFEVKITDFSISSKLSVETQNISNPNSIEGTLAYMSPEQTGRMNRSIDYRTDFYSLGVTFYEMLTGHLPFDITDPMELVHCHIAKQPMTPQQIVPSIPSVISEIVMKLLAKTAEDRYQSAFGLKADLENCLTQLQETGQISSFPIGRQDVSGKLQIPQKLYGRDREVNALLDTFERIAEGTSAVMLVAGYSGIGKSALVNEIHKPIVTKRGYFISGKFDQFKRNIPYSCLIQAFQDLVRQLLTESEQQSQIWKQKLLEALGSNGQVIIDVIPEIELIIGEQPEIPELGSTESQNRFNLVFQKFMGVFTKKEHPLVMFLDDLQWADTASLNLINLLLSDADSQYLLLIGAYRNNEVDAMHPFIQMVDNLQELGVRINALTLQPLNNWEVNQLIADTLNCTPGHSQPLAELIVNKTNGNPFFLTQLLKSLYSENLLTFNFITGIWQWEIEQIKRVEITDNVVDLMVNNIQKLEATTQEIVKLAACIGSKFDLKTLSIVQERAPLETADRLWSAISAGLILPLDNDYKLLVESEIFNDLNVEYNFLHDRVQQAAYSLISDEEKKEVHLKVGQLLLNSTNPEEREDKIFDIVNHLNIGAELITEQSARDELAELNLIGGKKAKAATAYEPAVKYLTAGLELLSGESWECNYELTSVLYLETVEAEYLNANFDRAAALSAIALQRAENLLEIVKLYDFQIGFYISQNQMQSAIDLGVKALEMLGVSLEQQPPEKLAIADLTDLPDMTDPSKLAAMQILISLVSPAFIAKPDLVLPIIWTSIDISKNYGNSAPAIYSYGLYGLIVAGGMGDISLGYQFGQLATELLKKFDAKELQCKIYHLVGSCIFPWKEHSRKNRELRRKAIQSGLETGDLDYVAYAAMYDCLYEFFSGDNLESVTQIVAPYINLVKKLKKPFPIDYVSIWGQGALNLRGISPDKCSLTGDLFNEALDLPRLLEANNLQSLYSFRGLKSLIYYLFKNYKKAIENARLAKQYAEAVITTIVYAEHNFYYSLALLADYPNAETAQQQEYITLVAENQEKMQRWATHAPMNFQHKYELVEAERYRVLGDALTAMEYYDKAIAGAREQGYTQDEAIAYERASEFYLSLGREKIARDYIKEAHYAYIRWGATAKVKDLEAEYPYLKTASAVTSANTRNTTSSFSRTTSSGSGEALDLSTVMKSSQAISGEIVLDKLLAKLMKILIENAGAQKGFLILSREGKLQIEAKTAVDSEEVLVETQALSSDNLPLKVINYVERTRTDIVLSNAAVDGQFTADPYIAQQELKSLLCAPILNQGNLIGIVYLENNLTTAAFTTQRLEIVRVLSSQAAISLENALLYQTLEQKVRDRTAQLAEANQEITLLNERLKADNIRMSAELDVTRKLQRMILPTEDELSQIPGLEIAGFMEPAQEVGGDYYDVIKSGERVKIGIGDVTGHGLESGVLMIMVQTAVRALLENNETDSNQFLEALNRTIYKNVTRMNSDKNLSLSLLDYEEGILRLSGQHEEAIVVRAGGEIERIDTMNLGFPIGLEAEIADFVAQIEIPLNSGDVVVLYTDGITEAEDINGMQYGLERLTETISRNWQLSANEIKQALVDDVRQHIGEQKVYDDITMVVLKKK